MQYLDKQGRVHKHLFQTYISDFANLFKKKDSNASRISQITIHFKNGSYLKVSRESGEITLYNNFGVIVGNSYTHPGLKEMWEDKYLFAHIEDGTYKGAEELHQMAKTLFPTSKFNLDELGLSPVTKKMIAEDIGVEHLIHDLIYYGSELIGNAVKENPIALNKGGQPLIRSLLVELLNNFCKREEDKL